MPSGAKVTMKHQKNCSHPTGLPSHAKTTTGEQNFLLKGDWCKIGGVDVTGESPVKV